MCKACQRLFRENEKENAKELEIRTFLETLKALGTGCKNCQHVKAASSSWAYCEKFKKNVRPSHICEHHPKFLKIDNRVEPAGARSKRTNSKNAAGALTPVPTNANIVLNETPPFSKACLNRYF